jgi:uncharacterized protein (DUF362 family)
VIFNAEEFVFKAPPAITRARRVLIKPSAGYPMPYPVSTSRELMASIIQGIRDVSDTDIIILEGTPTGESVGPVFKSLGYDFPRVLTLDVKDTTLVEVDSPLLKPLAIPTFMVPNVILSSDYLISVTPLKIINQQGWLSIANLLSLLPSVRYGDGAPRGWKELFELDINMVLADLYYTMPFDLGIIEAREIFIGGDTPARGQSQAYGKIFAGEPYQVDREASHALGLKTEYLRLIDEARVDLEV